MKGLIKLLAVILAFGLVSCATIMRGTSQSISVNSNPSGARIVVMGMEKGTTPAVIKVKRSETNVIVRLQKDGYEPVDIALTRSLSGWVWGNVVFGGVIGLVVDFATGGLYNINPEVIQADLKAVQSMNEDSIYPKAFVEIQLVDVD